MLGQQTTVNGQQTLCMVPELVEGTTLCASTSSLGFDNYITEENNYEYIKRTGQLEINNDEDLQFNYMLNFMKSQSKIWNLNKLVYDIENQDPQTMDDWKQSKDGLQKVI